MIANDTQPNKLYRNLRNGTFEDVAVRAGVAFSEDGKARAGMGVDAADFDNSGRTGIAITNFDNEMVALYQPAAGGTYKDIGLRAGVGQPSRNTLGFGCAFVDINLDGHLDLVVANGHIDETVRQIHGNVGYAQAPHLFLNDGKGNFRDVASQAGAAFALPKVARGLAYGDFDRDGDVDLLVTTNGGGALLYPQRPAGHRSRSLRLRLAGTKSNRDAVGAVARVFSSRGAQSRMVKTGSSYLSQSELALTFGLPAREAVRVVVEWPSGAVQEFKNVQPGSYTVTEGSLPVPA